MYTARKINMALGKSRRFRKGAAPTTSNKDDSEVKSSGLAQRAAYPVFLSLGRAKPSRSVSHGTRIRDTVTHTQRHVGSYDLFPKSTSIGSKESVARFYSVISG